MELDEKRRGSIDFTAQFDDSAVSVPHVAL